MTSRHATRRTRTCTACNGTGQDKTAKPRMYIHGQVPALCQSCAGSGREPKR